MSNRTNLEFGIMTLPTAIYSSAAWHAECQLHKQISSQYMGIDTEGMLFLCKSNKSHAGHTFRAKQPRGTPKNVEQLRQQQEQIEKAKAVLRDQPRKGAKA